MKINTRESWRRFFKHLNPEGCPDETYALITAHYNETNRKYHNLTHIEKCLSHYEQTVDFLDSPLTVEAAIWFHDIIYDTKASDNEEKSAEFAASLLSDIGMRASDAAGVSRLILSTKHTSVPDDNDSKYMVDIDLSILGAPEEEYSRYESAIAEEYSWVPVQVFADKRTEILTGFLEREHIFNTEVFQTKYELSARKNIKRAIDMLSNRK